MNIKSHSSRKYLLLLVISALTISAMACNLMKLVYSDPYSEPRSEDEWRRHEEEQFHHDEEPFRGEEEDFHHDPHHEGEFHHDEEEFHHDEQPYHGKEGEFHHEEPRHEEPHHEEFHHEEPHHEEFHHEEPHHEEPRHEEPHHEEGPPPGEGCLPESGCPGQQPDDSNVGGEWTTDIAVTDIYPGNQPHGQFHVRITNHGPGTLNNVRLELGCGYDSQDKKTGLVGPSDMKYFSVTLGMRPGETQSFPTGLNLDSSAFSYLVGCSASPGFHDPNPSNNDYNEILN